ncbi:hypothetical protein MSPP1_001043 [Malassezia sp. CBS 17886]|nr:hypothetical protein MSPP1_001043 [Malassezia sp. CBS 17886]
MARLPRRASTVLLGLLALFLLGTVLVLSTVRSLFRVEVSAFVEATELGTWDEIRAGARPAVLDAREPHGAEPRARIPKIIHQTWKTETLPERWAPFMLWTDAGSRAFLAAEYPWFLDTFDSYPYNIQRADAIRYFVLHKHGGVYMDLDIGCRRRLDPLLRFDAVLPKTIPVGVSNDLMFSAPQHPFTEMMIHALPRFNHYFLTHYATVMFSTGPMFVSALYRMFADEYGAARASSPAEPDAGFAGIRILPKSLYGKNAKPSDAPDSFFEHLYGSSWHAGDADFLIFLRKHGRLLIALGVLVVLIGFRRAILRPLLSAPIRAARALLARILRGPHGARAEWIGLDAHDDPTMPLTRDADGAAGVSTPTSHIALFDTSMSPMTIPAPEESRTRRTSSASLREDEASCARAALADHSMRTAETDAALGSYNKHAQHGRSASVSASLPSFYVDSASEYAIDDRTGYAGWNDAPPLSRERRTGGLGRVSRKLGRVGQGTLRSVSMAPGSLLSFAATPIRAAARRGDARTPAESVDEPGAMRTVPLTRVSSDGSDDYRHEWATLMQSPPTSDAGMSPPATLLRSPAASTDTHVSGIMRRPPGDLTRAMTPAVTTTPTNGRDDAHFAGGGGGGA